MSKTILITGGTGYIGSHGVVTFEKAGYQTVIVDNLSNSSIKVLDGIQNILGYKPIFYELDIRDKEKLKAVFKKHNFDGVVHFAGLKAVGESCDKPLEYFDNNIVGTIRLFECMQEYGVKNIIFSSSATVYKEKTDGSGYTEEDIVGYTTNPYGTTKFLIENILKDLARFASFNVVNLRYFNPIGAHSSGFIGENPNGIPNNLLPYVMKVAIGELKEVYVFGNDYNTSDGTGLRDYIDVCDLIDGHLKSYDYIKKTSQNGFFETFNLGTGKGRTVLEIIKTVSEVSGKNIPYKIVGRRPGDIAASYCIPDKANKILNWQAKTSLAESIRNMYKFYAGVHK